MRFEPRRTLPPIFADDLRALFHQHDVAGIRHDIAQDDARDEARNVR